MSRLIDADSLKDELNAWARVILKPKLMGADEVMCVIDHAPTIDAVPKWIPCSERLPGSYGKYIVTRSNSICGVYINLLCYADPDFDFGGEARCENDNPCWFFYDSEYGDCPVDDVIAWMPLPEPYKTDGKEQEDEE